MFMNLNNKLEWLYSLEAKGIKFGLDRIETLANALGNPHEKFQSIHIAGTNGKGSVAKMLYTVLRQAGYSVGLYTSPHLVRFNERIVVDDQEIKDAEIENLIEKIKPVIEKEKIDASFFEFTTAMAFAYFNEKKVDVAVIETGMGGRLDATNIVKPIINIITRISPEHQQHLGNALEKIAGEKAGIIKPGIPVVTPNNGKPVEVIERVCREKGTELVLVMENSEVKLLEGGLDFQRIVVDTSVDSYNIKTRLIGKHQLENLATAVIASEVLRKKLNLDKKAIEKGISNTYWAARLEVIKKKPLVILDGSHNLMGFRSLRLFIEEHIKNKFNKLIVVLGISEDKDKDLMIPLIADLADEFILCQADYKGTDTKELKELLTKNKKSILEIKNVENAVKKAFENSEEGDAILITGSIFVAGEAKQAIQAVIS